MQVARRRRDGMKRIDAAGSRIGQAAAWGAFLSREDLQGVLRARIIQGGGRPTWDDRRRTIAAQQRAIQGRLDDQENQGRSPPGGSWSSAVSRPSHTSAIPVWD